MKTILQFILITILLTSCKTSFRISVKKPSIVSIPSEVRSLGVINNVTPENSPEKKIEVLIRSQSINGNAVAGERAVEGVLRGLGQSNSVTGKIIESISIRDGSGNINWVLVDSLCNIQNVEAIIELAEIQTISPIGGGVLANVAGQSSTRLDGEVFSNIYISKEHQSIERLKIQRYYNIPISGSISIIDILSDIKRKQEYYRALGFELGYGTGRLLYPNWIWVNRNYYTRGTNALKRAKPMIKAGNWQIAEKQLLQDIDFPKEKKRGRVLFNLALVKEGQGDIDSAIMYAEKAALECGDKLANNYLVELRKRKAQMEQM